MSQRGSKFIPSKIPSVQSISKKLKLVEEQVSLHRKTIDAIAKSHDTHITMLSNFARHDIKNSVQSIDTILASNTLEELTEKHMESMKFQLDIVRETIDNFSKLVPYSDRENFSLAQLISAVELLNRENLYISKIQLIKDIGEEDINFNLPFQSVLQMLNNIIINAIKAFDGMDCDKKIKISADHSDDCFSIKIFDNASNLMFKNIDSIFEYGISSTGGSGIGLFHARYLCKLYNGDISVHIMPDDLNFNKYFLINLPLIKETK